MMQLLIHKYKYLVTQHVAQHIIYNEGHCYIYGTNIVQLEQVTVERS